MLFSAPSVDVGTDEVHVQKGSEATGGAGAQTEITTKYRVGTKYTGLRSTLGLRSAFVGDQIGIVYSARASIAVDRQRATASSADASIASASDGADANADTGTRPDPEMDVD